LGNPSFFSFQASCYILLEKQSNVAFMLTTQYNICNCVNREKKDNDHEKDKDNLVSVCNYRMNVVNEKNTYINTYQLMEGISMDRNGTYQIFADLQYPSSILHSLLELYQESQPTES
jgi:hypothetical protein